MTHARPFGARDNWSVDDGGPFECQFPIETIGSASTDII